MAKVALPTPSVGLYVDPESGLNISTNSMMKTFRRCPKQAEYKYHLRLKPKILSTPLTRGKWMHSLLEAYYKGKDWKKVHKKLTSDFNKLFDEERDKLGNLPKECEALMVGYLWHYKAHEWRVIGVEQTLETKFPDGSIFRGRYDMLIEDEYGLWLVDHKNHKTFPRFDFRLGDAQSALYLWAARKEGINVQGFIWNYLKTKPMTMPTPIQDGSRLSLTTMKNCDYPTAVRGLKAAGIALDDPRYATWLKNLKRQRYKAGRPQTSEFFQRHILEKSDAMLDRVAMEYYHTSLRMHDYDFSVSDAVERVVNRDCTYMCSYTNLCQTQLLGGNDALILRKEFKKGDPMDYYYDESPFEADKEQA